MARRTNFQAEPLFCVPKAPHPLDQFKQLAASVAREVYQRVRSMPVLKRRGRRKGCRDIDELEALHITVAIDVYGYKKTEVLRAVGRPPDESRSYYRWLNQRLELGRTHFHKLLRGLRVEMAPLATQLRSAGKYHRKAFLFKLLGKSKDR